MSDYDRACRHAMSEYERTQSIFFKCRSRAYKDEIVHNLHIYLDALKCVSDQCDRVRRTIEYLEPRVDKLFKKYCE